MRKVEDGLHWLERAYGGRRIYLCWYASVGAMGQKYVYKTLLGKEHDSGTYQA